MGILWAHTGAIGCIVLKEGGGKGKEGTQNSYFSYSGLKQHLLMKSTWR